MFTTAVIAHKEQIAPAWWRFTITAETLSVLPGQFLLVRCGTSSGSQQLLRRPIFPYQVSSNQFCLLQRPEPDPAVAWLLSRQPDDTLDLLGPFGTGFIVPKGAINLLLISDNWLISPLLGQIHQTASRQLSVTLALGALRASQLYPPANLPPDVEIQITTLDGSVGQPGQVTDLLPSLLPWADVVFAVGSTELYQSLKTMAQAQRFGTPTGFTYGLISNPLLPCGVGACFTCTLQTTAGQKFVCRDGPVFDLMTIALEETNID